jgi:hypothetical protein
MPASPEAGCRFDVPIITWCFRDLTTANTAAFGTTRANAAPTPPPAPSKQ